MGWGFPLYELIVAFERGRIHMRGLDQEMELLDYAGDVHEIITPSRETSRWDKYDASFDKSDPPISTRCGRASRHLFRGSPGPRELQFEASLKRSIAEQRPVDP